MVTIHGRKLYRSRKDKVFAGILGGLGEFFNIDPVLLRLAFMILVILTGFWPGVILYLIAMFIVPIEPDDLVYEQKVEDN